MTAAEAMYRSYKTIQMIALYDYDISFKFTVLID